MEIAVAYLRMSTDEQTTSIELQRNEIERVFGHRFQIIEWYVDEGQSGSHSLHKRVNFLRMLDDSDKRQFQFLLCYNISRFSRLDAIDAAICKKVLRGNGVKLITAVDGEIDWTTSTGRIMDSVRTEAQHEFAVNLSKGVCDGKKLAFNNGTIPGQVTPYGFSRLITESNGTQRIVKRTERFQRLKQWSQTLIPGEDIEVETVKWIFEEFNKRDVSFHRLAVELNEKGIASPTGKHWIYPTVHDILINIRYAGGLSYGKNASGKHHRLIGGEIVKTSDKEKHCRKKSDFLIRYGTHEGLISRELFEAVQTKVQRRWRTGKHASGEFALTGVLYCGHCGKPLYGNEREKNAKNKKGVRYICKGIHRGSGCGQWGVREEQILPFIIRTVIDQIGEKEVSAAHLEMPKRRSADMAPMKKQLSKLKATYETNWDRFLAAEPGDFANELQERLQSMKKEIAQLEQQISENEHPESTKDLWKRRWAFLAEIKQNLMHITTWKSPGGEIGFGYTVTKSAFRELLHRAELRVDLWWEKSSANRYRIVRGRLRLGRHAADIDPAQNETPASLIV